MDQYLSTGRPESSAKQQKVAAEVSSDRSSRKGDPRTEIGRMQEPAGTLESKDKENICLNTAELVNLSFQ